MEKLTESQMIEKVETTLCRGASAKYPLTIYRASVGNILEIEFEGTRYKMQITEIGPIEDDE